MCIKKCFISVLGTLMLSACNELSEVPVEVVFHSQHCQIDQAGLEVLDADRLASTIAAAQAFMLNKSEEQHELGPDEQVILVSWGSKPNAAYHLKLSASQAIFQDGQLKLPVEFIEPKPGMMTAQMMTSPCIIVKTKRHEAIREISAGSFLTEVK